MTKVRPVIRKNPGLGEGYSIFMGSYPQDGETQENFAENVAPDINNCVENNVNEDMGITEIHKAVKKCAQ